MRVEKLKRRYIRAKYFKNRESLYHPWDSKKLFFEKPVWEAASWLKTWLPKLASKISRSCFLKPKKVASWSLQEACFFGFQNWLLELASWNYDNIYCYNLYLFFALDNEIRLLFSLLSYSFVRSWKLFQTQATFKLKEALAGSQGLAEQHWANNQNSCWPSVALSLKHLEI